MSMAAPSPQTASTPRSASVILQDDELFARTFLKIQRVDGSIVPFTYNQVQRHLMHNLTGLDLVLKARQEGVSTAIQGRLFRKVVIGSAMTATIAHDHETTQKLRRMAERFYRNMPDGLRPYRALDNERVATYPDFDSTSTITTAGSVHSGRGGTYTDIHGSEVAYWKDAEALLSGIMQGGDPRLILESTANGANGYFYELCIGALEGKNRFRLHFYEWWREPRYQVPLEPGERLHYTEEERNLVRRHRLSPAQIKWRRMKIVELPRTFLQEYPEDPRTAFLLSGNSYFGEIDRFFTAPMNATFQEGRRYCGGLDFAQDNDYTVLSIIDGMTLQQVELLRMNRLEWREMRARIVAAAKKWNLWRLVPEANSMGKTNIEALRAELAEAEVPLWLTPFYTTEQSKALAVTNLYAGLHEGGLRLLPIPEQRREFAAFRAKQNPHTLKWKYEAAAGEHDDTVIADMLAWHGLTAPLPIMEFW